MRQVLVLWLGVVLIASTVAQAELEVQVFTAKPEGFEVNSVLIKGKTEAILVDAQFRLSDAYRLAADLVESGKTLTTVYVSHSHPDHYFGYEVVKRAFPSAKYVALPSVVKDIKATWKEKLDAWKPMFGANLTSAPLVPKAVDKLTLDGETLEIKGEVQGDEKNNSYVWIPSIKTVITGDIVYNSVYPWMAETNSEERKDWIASVEKIASLQPEQVIAGHQVASAPHTRASLQFMREYIARYDDLQKGSKSALELIEKVQKEYPKLGQPGILEYGANQAFPKK